LSVGAAIRDALQMIKQQLIDLAPSDSEFASAESKELQFRDGKLTLNGGDGVGFDELLSSAMRDKVAAVGNFSRDGESSSSTSNHSFGAQFIEVAVDEELGLVRVRRMLGCFACGTILNAKTARSQFLGGMVMGVGHALQEATHWDHRLGRITNDNLAEYHVPVNADIPNVDVMIYDEPDFNASPIGAKGIGEIGITGVAAAVSNAIYNATGRRFRALPITPEHVMSRGYDV
jgi:xanthine dehydrogenase YagR molybdenum-binding subunit